MRNAIIYIITEDDTQSKIGWGDDLVKRLASCQTGNYRILSVAWHSKPMLWSRAREVCRRVYLKLGPDTITGDWYDLDPDSASEVVLKELAGTVEQYSLGGDFTMPDNTGRERKNERWREEIAKPAPPRLVRLGKTGGPADAKKRKK